MTINTILFDLDGTLVDTAPDLAYALNQVLIKHQRAPLPFANIRPFASAGAAGLLKAGFGAILSIEEFASLREAFLAEYTHCVTRHVALFPDMENVLQFIEEQGLRWGVVTNKSAAFSKAILDHLKLTQRCACLIGGDQVRQLKPDPEGLLKACQQLATLPQQTLYVGDAERDIQAARAAPMTAIAVLYGYREAHENPLLWQADSIAATPEELLTCLQTHLLLSNVS